MIVNRLISIILVVVGYCSFVAPNGIGEQTIALWRESYDKIFGPITADCPLMSERQMLRSIMFLHNSADDLESIDEDDKDDIEFWHNRAFGFFAPDNNVDFFCDVDYVQEVSKRYDQQNIVKNHNFEQLYIIFRKNIMEFCDRHFRDLPARLESVVPQEKLTNLVNTYTEGKVAHLGAFPASVLETVGIVHEAAGANLIDTWNNGPCGVILSTLRQSGMKHYSKFVDMGLDEGRKYLAHCSKPVRFWINLVGMCRDIDTLVPYTVDKSDPEKLHTAGMWNKTYERIFGQDVERLSEKQVHRSTAFLQSKADQLTTSIDEAQKDVVYFWHKALSELRIEDCRLEYLEKHAAIHEEQNIKKNPNFKLVFLNFVKNMIRFCDGHFSDLNTKMASKVSDNHLLSMLNAVTSETPPTTSSASSQATSSFIRIPSDRQLAGALTSSMIEAIESGKKGDEIIVAWNDGPCGQVLTTIRAPEMVSYSDFADMILFEGRQFLKYCTEPNQVWTRVVDICKLLDHEIAAYAHSGLSASSVREFIRMDLSAHSAPHLSLLYV